MKERHAKIFGEDSSYESEMMHLSFNHFIKGEKEARK